MDQQQKARLGERFTCFQCGTKFYTLNKPEPTCPECSADQRNAPVRDIRAILAANKGKRKVAQVDDEESELGGDEEVGEDEDLFDDMDDDDDDGADGDDEEEEEFEESEDED